MFFNLLLFLLSLINYSSEYLLRNNEIDSRIFGGSLANIKNFPYQVSLRRRSNINQHFCGGSIVSKRHILTAAHCATVNASDIIVVVGTSFVSHGGKRYRVKRIIVHEKYPEHIEYDVALLVTGRKITYSETVRPIPLQSKDVGGGIKGTATGWGATKKTLSSPVVQSDGLQQIQLSTISPLNCWIRMPLPYKRALRVINICTLMPKGKGVCYGDSGGPFVVDGKLTGIASWISSKKCGGGVPDVFASVVALRPWITSKMKIQKKQKI